MKKYVNKIYNKKLRVEIVKNGIVLPLKNKKGGVLDEKGNFVSLSYHKGEWFKFGGKYNYEQNNLNYDNEAIVYLGVFIDQWGHFILDSLSRAWIVDKLDDVNKYKYAFINRGSASIDGNFLETLRLLNIKESQIMTIDKPTKFKEIIIPEMSTDENHGFTKDYPMIFKRMIKNADISHIKVPTKVYLTRTNLKKAKLKEVGEKVIEDNFRINNYTVVSPEKLSVVEQIAYFQKAETIVCLNGSIPFNIIFAAPSLELLIINKTSLPHLNIHVLMCVSGIKPIFVDGFYEPLKSFPRSLGEGPFLLGFTPQLKNYFVLHGLKFNDEKKATYISNFCKYMCMCIAKETKNIVKKALKK